jgi:hypothetical protein
MRQSKDLRPYQQRIATHLYCRDEALCVARPGSGKTAAALTAIFELLRDGVARHALVIAPKRVAVHVWPEEIAEWAHLSGLRYAVLDGSVAKRLKLLKAAPERDLTIIGIDLIQWLLEQLAGMPDDHPLFDLLVFDEISRLRNPTGKRVQALCRQSQRWKVIWGLTGTLRPSSAEDMFMPAKVITRSKLWGKSFYAWQKQYFYPTDYNGRSWAPFPDAVDKLNADIAPLAVTLAEGEMPYFPALNIIFDNVTLPPRARELYNQMETRLGIQLGADKIITAANAAVAVGKLAQMANGFVYDAAPDALRLHDAKRDWLSDIIVDAGDRPTILIYEFIQDLKMIRELLGEDIPYLGDGVTDKASRQAIEDWNGRRLPFLALHPASGGHGLNLQPGGSDMAWIGPTWSPEYWEQTIARLHRSGQTEPVVVRVCRALDTIDTVKINRVHFKMRAQEAFEAYLRSRLVTHPGPAAAAAAATAAGASSTAGLAP